MVMQSISSDFFLTYTICLNIIILDSNPLLSNPLSAQLSFSIPLESKKETNSIIRASNTFHHQYFVCRVPRPSSLEGLRKLSIQLYSQLTFICSNVEWAYSLIIMEKGTSKSGETHVQAYVLSLPEGDKFQQCLCNVFAQGSQLWTHRPRIFMGLVTSTNHIVQHKPYCSQMPKMG